MKIAVIGGVKSTAITIEELNQHGYTDVTVYGYQPSSDKVVSGLTDLQSVSKKASFGFQPFTKLNDLEVEIISAQYDWIFAVGLSQLISDAVVSSAKSGCIGFHPTKLPQGRGRAPMAWVAMGEVEGAATFFRIEPGQEGDAGDILVQEPYELHEEDTLLSLHHKLYQAMGIALGKLLPALQNGSWKSFLKKQESAEVSYLGIRTPEDGVIDWNMTAAEIQKHIKASSEPHPGAFTFCGTHKIHVGLDKNKDVPKAKGVVGRILQKRGNSYLVQAGDAPVWIVMNEDFRVGQQLGTVSAKAMYDLQKRIDYVESKLKELLGDG